MSVSDNQMRIAHYSTQGIHAIARMYNRDRGGERKFQVRDARWGIFRAGFARWNTTQRADAHLRACFTHVRACVAHMHTDNDRTKSMNYRQTLHTIASNAHSPKVAKTSDNESRRDSGSHSDGNKANLGKTDDPRTEATESRAVWTLWKWGRMPVSSEREQKPLPTSTLECARCIYNSDLDLILLWDCYCKYSNLWICETVTRRFGIRKKFLFYSKYDFVDESICVHGFLNFRNY